MKRLTMYTDSGLDPVQSKIFDSTVSWYKVISYQRAVTRAINARVTAVGRGLKP